MQRTSVGLLNHPIKLLNAKTGVNSQKVTSIAGYVEAPRANTYAVSYTAAAAA